MQKNDFLVVVIRAWTQGVWFCQWRVLRWWWEHMVWDSLWCFPTPKFVVCTRQMKIFSRGMTKILQNVLWSSSEPAQSIWLCQWGVLRWRWLSTWCGTLPTSVSTYLDLKLHPPNEDIFLGLRNLCVNYAFFFQCSHQSLHRVYGSLAMVGVLNWWWLLSTRCGTLSGAS